MDIMLWIIIIGFLATLLSWCYVRMRSSTVVESSPDVVEPYLTGQELEEEKRIEEIWDEHRAVLEEARKTIQKEGDKCPVHPLRKLKMKDVGYSIGLQIPEWESYEIWLKADVFPFRRVPHSLGCVGAPSPEPCLGLVCIDCEAGAKEFENKVDARRSCPSPHEDDEDGFLRELAMSFLEKTSQ